MLDKKCEYCGNERHSGEWSCKNWALYKEVPYPAPGFVPSQKIVQEKIDDLVVIMQVVKDAGKLQSLFLPELQEILSGELDGEEVYEEKQYSEVHQGVVYA